MYGDEACARLLPRLDDRGCPRADTDPAEEDSRRPSFARDYDRPIHTGDFRRLQGKTQVVTPGQADFFRTRLTHTIEVAQIARRLAYRLCHSAGTDRAMEVSDVCEAASILHDFGHPPFGHVGDGALSAALDGGSKEMDLAPMKVGGYEGNAQSFRLAVWTIGRRTNRGLQLTRATLDAAIKYPWTREKPDNKKWSYFESEAWAYEWVRKGVPTEREKSFEAQIMDWADDVAYATHDLEDWCRAGYIPLAMLSQSSIARTSLANKIVEAWRRKGTLHDPSRPDARAERGDKPSEDEVRGAVDDLFSRGAPFYGFSELGTEYDGSSAAKAAMAEMRQKLFDLFIDGVSTEGDVEAGRHQADLHVATDVRLRNRILQEMLRIYVIEHPRMTTYEHGQREVLKTLVQVFLSILTSSDKDAINAFPRDMREALMQLRSRTDDWSKTEVLRRVADHVSGMTDSYALMMHQRLAGGAGSFHAWV